MKTTLAMKITYFRHDGMWENIAYERVPGLTLVKSKSTAEDFRTNAYNTAIWMQAPPESQRRLSIERYENRLYRAWRGVFAPR